MKKPSDAFEFIGRGARFYIYRKGWIAICIPILYHTYIVNCHTSIKEVVTYPSDQGILYCCCIGGASFSLSVGNCWLANLLIPIWSTLKIISFSTVPCLAGKFHVSFWCSGKEDGSNFRVKDKKKLLAIQVYQHVWEETLHLSIYHPTFSSDARGVAEPSTDVSVAQSMLVVVVVC